MDAALRGARPGLRQRAADRALRAAAGRRALFARPGHHAPRRRSRTRVPLTAGHRRTVVDVALYAALVAAGRAGAPGADGSTPAVLVPIVVVARRARPAGQDACSWPPAPEHYLLATVVVFCCRRRRDRRSPGRWWSSSRIWWGAATLEAQPPLPERGHVMVSNRPLLRGARGAAGDVPRTTPTTCGPPGWRRAGARRARSSSTRSRWCSSLGGGGTPTTIALVVMLVFHTSSRCCFPLGVPLEWNVLLRLLRCSCSSASTPSCSPWDLATRCWRRRAPRRARSAGPSTAACGRTRSRFLPAMRYYAGNWAAQLWLFRKGEAETPRRAPHQDAPDHRPPARPPLRRGDHPRRCTGKLRAFRSMHLHGRALNAVLPEAVDDLDAYDVNRGRGRRRRASWGGTSATATSTTSSCWPPCRPQCGYAPGDLRVPVPRVPARGPARLHWRIVDAATGQLDEGHARRRHGARRATVARVGMIDAVVVGSGPERAGGRRPSGAAGARGHRPRGR